MSGRNAEMSDHFLQFSTDEFKGTGNDTFRPCTRNSAVLKAKTLLWVRYTHHSAFSLIALLMEAEQLVPSAFQPPKWEWFRECSGQRSPVQQPWQWHDAGNVLQTQTLSLASFLRTLLLLIIVPSTWHLDVEHWFCQSYKYLVYSETDVTETFPNLNALVPDLIFALCFRPWGLAE